MVVAPQEEYPRVCIGVTRGTNTQLPVNVKYINLNSNTSWFTNSGLGTFTSEFLVLDVDMRLCVCVCVC